MERNVEANPPAGSAREGPLSQSVEASLQPGHSLGSDRKGNHKVFVERSPRDGTRSRKGTTNTKGATGFREPNGGASKPWSKLFNSTASAKSLKEIPFFEPSKEGKDILIESMMMASESEWLEVSEDEDDSDGEQSNSGSGSEGTDDDVETSNDGAKSLAMGVAVVILKGEAKNLRRREKQARIEQIRANLGLSDSQRTPMPGESLRDFYKRTNLYWQMAVHEHTQHTGMELRKDGFDLAESRYKELKPILDELAILETEQKAEEAEGPETSSRKKGIKKNRAHGSQR